MHNYFGDEDAFHPPWPIWEDSAINSIKWIGDPKVKRNWVFEDPVDHGALPASISVDKWKRPNIEDEARWTLAPEEAPVDFTKYNSHLMKYKIMTMIMSSIQTLEEIGRKQPFGIEYQSTSFWYNGGLNWKPWNHVYSLTKAGKGTVHSLQLNKSGLYIVRLFYMGSWRRIVVDDHLPYNSDNEPLLPRSENKYNLWPQILAKGILRIASLSWTSLNDVEDFSVITCLTGWTRCVLDCSTEQQNATGMGILFLRQLRDQAARRCVETEKQPSITGFFKRLQLATINEVWDVIQMHLIREEMNKQEIKPFCLTTPSQTCLNEFKFYCSDDPRFRTLFACISRTENELQNISPAEEHLICIMEAKIEMEDSLKELPLWKKVRWLDWIRNNNSKKFLEMIQRIVKVYSPMRKRYTPNPYKEETIRKLADKIVSGEISSGSLKLLLYAELTPEEKQIPAEDTEEFLTYRFCTLYPHIRELEVHYKSANFLHSEESSNLDKILHSEKIQDKFKSQLGMRNTSKQSSHGTKNIFPASVHDNYKMKCIFLYSESQHCKNFLITLTVCNGSRDIVDDGYLAFEEYNWKSRVMGKVLFSLWTLGSKTHFLQLGNSIQVCRIWYNMPTIEYHISIKGNTPFELINEEMLHHKLSVYSGSVINYGVKLSSTFGQMRLGILNTPEHYALISYFKKSLYPPVFDTLEADYKAKLVDDFNEVFDECLTELIFEKSNVTKAIACLEAMKILFHDNQLGVTTIQQLTDGEMEEFEDLKSIAISFQKKFYCDKIVDKLKSFSKAHEIDEANIEAPSMPYLKSMSMTNQKYPLYNSDDIAIFDDPENCIELLRKILNKKREYENLYPFRNELDMKLKFREYQGSTDVTPLHNWFLVIRLLVNVHSETDVPCAIKVKTSYPKVSLVVFEVDTCKQVLCSFDVNSVYYLSRKKGGYAILVYGYPTEEMIKEQITIFWKIKIIGVDESNILHCCYKTPVLCQHVSAEPFGLHVQSITGFYIPNVDNIIGRFQIKSKTSPAITLYISLSRNHVRMRVVLRGKDREVCVAEGTGEVLIPIALLDQDIAVPSAYDPEKSIFRGEIQLVGLWELDKNERIFEQKLRAQPQKDILSFDDFQDAPFDEFNDDDENIEEEELPEVDDSSSTISYPERRNLRKKTKDKSFDVNTEEDSDDISVISLKKFERKPPFGLLSYSPHWRISMILDELDEEGTTLEHDDQKCKTYEMFTQSWEENDPGRAERADEIRREFLMFGKTNFMQMYLDPENLCISDFSDYSESKEEKEKERKTSIKKVKNNRKGRKSKYPNKNIHLTHDGLSRISTRNIKRMSNIQKDGNPHSEQFMYGTYIKPSDKSSTYNLKNNHLYEQKKWQLRSGVFPFVSKPLYSKKNHKLRVFRCPPQKCSFSSGTIVSSSSDFTQEVLDTDLFISSNTTIETQSRPPVFEPQMSLLANILPQELITPVSKLSKLYCSKLHEPTVIEDKCAPKDKSITKAFLKKYSLPSGNTELSSFNMNIFEFDLTPKKSKDKLTIKEMLEMGQEAIDLRSFVTEIVEPSLYYVSKRSISEDIFETPEEFKTQIKYGKAMNETFVMLKKEADAHLSALQDNLVLKMKKTSLNSSV